MLSNGSCAHQSRAAAEPLAGSFPPVHTFFLIESKLPDDGGWSKNAVKSASAKGSLAPVLQHLQAASFAKILFIRQPQSSHKNVYIALSNQAKPALYHCQLEDYDQLLQLELDSLQAGAVPRIQGTALQEVTELYAICVNGRHDPCCATYGMPVYQELVAQAGSERVWQCTHIGGHRMAATFIAFPQGIAYGHVDPPAVEAIVNNHRGGYMLPHLYRGRAAYAGQLLDASTHQAAQAAEAAIRERAGIYRIDALQLQDAERLDEDLRRLRFVDAAGTVHGAEVRQAWSAPRPTSCGDAPQPKPQYDVKLL